VRFIEQRYTIIKAQIGTAIFYYSLPFRMLRKIMYHIILPSILFPVNEEGNRQTSRGKSKSAKAFPNK
jgi:hypothetical protein